MTSAIQTVKRRYLFALAVVLLTVAGATGQSTSPVESPLGAPTGFVNDYAGVIDSATKQQIETKLTEFKARSTPPTELAVAVVRTTGDRQIFDFSLAVARDWKIGSKADDNPSALLLIAIDDRKYFTQVSRDLEDELPDGLVGSLQRQFLVPEFKKANYAKGISDTIDAYIRTIEERRSGVTPAAEATPDPKRRGERASPSLYSLFCCLLTVIVGFMILSSIFGKSGRGGRGGSDGGMGGALPWIIGSAIANSGSSSGSWGGSDSGGGGWGGFGGGGDFGGGGAGGDW